MNKKEFILQTVRPVTPGTLFRLNQLFKETSNPKLFIVPKVYKDLNRRFTPSPQTTSRVTPEPKSIKKLGKRSSRQSTKHETQGTISSNELRYSEYKHYHYKTSDLKATKAFRFLPKKPFKSFKPEPKSLKPLQSHEKGSKTIQEDLYTKEDTFLKNTIYSKPALTYGDKLYRLAQVSLF
jgi:hypothetical protein